MQLCLSEDCDAVRVRLWRCLGLRRLWSRRRVGDSLGGYMDRIERRRAAVERVGVLSNVRRYVYTTYLEEDS